MSEPAAASDAPAVSPARKWWALGYSGFLATISAWAWVAAIVAIVDDPELDVTYSPVPWVVTALVLVPISLAALAWATKRPRFIRSVAIAVGLVLVVGYVAVLAAREPITSAAAGYAAGAAMALRPEPGHGWKPRTIGVVGTTIYVFIMARTVLVFALAFGPMVAFMSVGFADLFMDRYRDRQAARRENRAR